MGMNDDKAGELLKDLRTLIDMLKGTEEEYGLLDWVDSYYGDYRQEAAEFLTEMENKYLNNGEEI